jgi:hypothetical protein
LFLFGLSGDIADLQESPKTRPPFTVVLRRYGNYSWVVSSGFRDRTASALVHLKEVLRVLWLSTWL